MMRQPETPKEILQARMENLVTAVNAIVGASEAIRGNARLLSRELLNFQTEHQRFVIVTDAITQENVDLKKKVSELEKKLAKLEKASP